jgi:SAM-dependent methyltransferase
MENHVERIKYWDRVAPEKRFSHPLRRDWLADHLGAQARILDYGCGYGRMLAELSRHGFVNLFGTDFSEGMLLRARLEAPHAALIRNDGKSFPLANASFDVVLLFAVLTCIPADQDQRQVITEVLRVLRPNGLLYISDLLLNDDERNRLRYEQYAETAGCYGVFELPEGVVVRHHRREWIEELTKAFRPLEHERFTVTTMNGNASAAFQYLARKPN